MPDDSPYDLAVAAYERFKRETKERFPAGHYVAAAGGEVIADAPSAEDLDRRLRGREPRAGEVFVHRVGDERELIPEYLGWIMMNAIIEQTLACLDPEADIPPRDF